MDRHRLLFLYLREHTHVFTEPVRLLHFAPEVALASTFGSVPGITYVRTDLHATGVDVGADITRLPFASESFDVIICSHVLEHVDDDAAAMRELRRVLAANGWVVVMIPIDVQRETTYEDPLIVEPSARRLHFGQGDHVRVYGRDFVARMERAGFVVVEKHPARALAAEAVRLHGLSDEPLFLCSKRTSPDRIPTWHRD